MQAKTVHHSGNGEGGGAYGRCPVVLRDTSIVVADVEGGAAITVKPEKSEELGWLRRETRERQDDGTKEIRDRVKHLLEVAKAPAPGAGHDGNGHGGGALGRCPIVLKDTTIAAKDVEGGAQISVKAKAAGGADALRRESHDRAENFGGK